MKQDDVSHRWSLEQSHTRSVSNVDTKEICGERYRISDRRERRRLHQATCRPTLHARYLRRGPLLAPSPFILRLSTWRAVALPRALTLQIVLTGGVDLGDAATARRMSRQPLTLARGNAVLEFEPSPPVVI
jgi:hypothetical protein